MKTVKKFIAICLLLANFCVHSQNVNAFDFSVGSLINSRFGYSETLVANDFSWKWSYRNTLGYFARLGCNINFKDKGKWNAYIPLGLSYIYQIESYHLTVTQKDVYSGTTVDGFTFKTFNKAISLNSGFGMRYQSNSWRICSELLFNMSHLLGSHTITTPNYGSHAYSSNFTQPLYSTIPNSSWNLLISTHFSAMRKVNKCLWVGPCLDLYLYNFLYVGSFLNFSTYYFIPARLNFSQSFYTSNLTGKNLWLNPGVKVQFDLR